MVSGSVRVKRLRDIYLGEIGGILNHKKRERALLKRDGRFEYGDEGCFILLIDSSTIILGTIFSSGLYAVGGTQL